MLAFSGESWDHARGKPPALEAEMIDLGYDGSGNGGDGDN
jgi:hypothetical protein